MFSIFNLILAVYNHRRLFKISKNTMNFTNTIYFRYSFIALTIIIFTCWLFVLTVANAEIDEITGAAASIDPSNIGKLPFCGGNEQQNKLNNRLVYVSTLDGTLTALDISDNGSVKWSLKTNPGDLLSSSIQNVELTNNGKWVRMIPSLNGGLYKFDGKTIEQVPITADHLLSSSYKFSDDLLISGGKETRSYGVSTRTGQIIYECSMNGCTNQTFVDDDEPDKLGPSKSSGIENQHDPLIDDLMIVRRETQTVRAIEPRTGEERWNFSVGHHNIEILRPNNCYQQKPLDLDQSLLDLQLKVIIPDGIICAVHKQTPNVIVWQYKFDHPIVNAWKTNENSQLENINLFEYLHWPYEEKPKYFENLSPSVYVGMFNKQLYIQESDYLNKKIIEKQLEVIERQYLEIPWKPVPATSSALALIEDDRTDGFDGFSSTTAMSLLYKSEYINGHGFFLYSSLDLNKTNPVKCDNDNTTDSNEDDDYDNNNNNNRKKFPEIKDADTPATIIIVSLWFWWKEIMVISLTTALILNVVMSRRLTYNREVVIVERHVEIKVPVSDSNSDKLMKVSNSSQRSISESTSGNGENFESRFQTDFEMVQCLGKGGFGVVFESKNKLDDCRYAIKRIVLPSRQESRDRVMREVKTLAHCEHHNIVRYFQAWVEQPPPGWQEKEDRIWMARITKSHSIDIESPTIETDSQSLLSSIQRKQQLPPTQQPPKNDLLFTNKLLKPTTTKLESWISNLNTDECINFDNDDVNRKTSFLDVQNFNPYNIDEDINNDESLPYHNNIDNSDSVFNDDDDDDDEDDDDDSDDEEENDIVDDENNDSFSIVFKDETQESITGKPKSKTTDSFQIVFDSKYNNSNSSTTSKDKNTTTSTSNNLYNNNNRGGGGGGHFGTIKKRTFSENDRSIFKRNSLGILPSTSLNINENGDLSLSIPAAVQQQNKIELFKKTHRRPLSLDLTSNNRRSGGGVGGDNVFSTTRMYLYIQMQLCKKQSLKDWLRLNCLKTRQNDTVLIFKQIVDGVEYCHMKGLIHRDLKPSNIFFALDGQIKIGDFGLVTGMSDELPCSPMLNDNDRPTNIGIYGVGGLKHTKQVGTHLYMSPEQLNGLPYNYKVDIYSLGLIFFELLVQFSTEMERIETLKGLRINNFPKEFPQLFPDEYELLKLMLSHSPKERPTTFGICARPPLCYNMNLSDNSDWHFELPPRRRDSHVSGSLSSNQSIITPFTAIQLK